MAPSLKLDCLPMMCFISKIHNIHCDCWMEETNRAIHILAGSDGQYQVLQ
jgi:hypothetical protein